MTTPTDVLTASPAGVGTLADLLCRGSLVDGDRTVTSDELVRLVAARADELALATRSVVVLTGSTSLEFVVTYLAVLRAGHVPLLAGSHADELASSWGAAALVTATLDGVQIERRATAAVELHDDLALLLSTSGSTGCPKLVRLSYDNLLANARSIVAYLELGPDDVGITSLPLHYCYGLSVLHSHLLAGGTVVLNRASVVDPCFRDALVRHGVTNVAGVPHTFELLEQAGPDRLAVPTLRFVTQAGGRMTPARVRDWAARLASWDARLFVMYGQTEATARMAYVPPAMVHDHPDTVGVPVPGGELVVCPIDDATLAPGVGELVYRGPNVMLGYATRAADLALGRTVDELRTGDLAEVDPVSGLVRIVGRRSRFVKPYGVRIALDDVERHLAPTADRWGTPVHVVGDDDGIVVVAAARAHGELRTRLASLVALPPHACAVVDVEVPHTDRGKPDAVELLARARRHDVGPIAAGPIAAAPIGASPVVDGPVADGPVDPVGDVFRTVLAVRTVRPTDTFVSLGGDSLSYVECSIRLEAALGHLPPDWHLVPVGEFPAPVRRRLVRRMDTSVLLRAAGILAVVATHMGLTFFPGGAHLMLGVVGYNVSRFLLDVEPARERRRAFGRAAARIAVPTMLWAAIGMLVFGAYGTGTALLVNNYVGPRSHAGDHWHFWFVEVLVHLTAIAAVLMAVPAVRVVERRWRYLFPLALLGVALVVRMEWSWFGDWYNMRFRTHGVAAFFVLGWLVHRSIDLRTRLATTAAIVVSVAGWFQRPQREWFIIGGLVLLVWCRQVVVPAPLVRPIATLAAASMWIYLTHFTVWPVVDDWFVIELAYATTLVVGVAAWLVVRMAEPSLLRLVRRGRAWVGRTQRGQATVAVPA